MAHFSQEARAAWVAAVVAILSLLISGYVGYAHSSEDASNRTTKVEVQQANDTKRLDRIESKIDRILEKMGGW